MSVEFLSKTKINKDFLAEIISQLKKDKEKKQSYEREEIFGKLIEDLGINKKSPGHFFLQENEYNFLTQNKKSFWADYLVFRYKFKIYPSLKKLTSFPTHLIVEPVSYCNLKCPMCFQSDQTFTKKPYMGKIEVSLFKKVVMRSVYECFYRYTTNWCLKYGRIW